MVQIEMIGRAHRPCSGIIQRHLLVVLRHCLLLTLLWRCRRGWRGPDPLVDRLTRCIHAIATQARRLEGSSCRSLFPGNASELFAVVHGVANSLIPRVKGRSDVDATPDVGGIKAAIPWLRVPRGSVISTESARESVRVRTALRNRRMVGPGPPAYLQSRSFISPRLPISHRRISLQLEELEPLSRMNGSLAIDLLSGDLAHGHS